MHLVIKLLKAPTLTPDKQVVSNEVGSPQGSILSPLLANVYLHDALDMWFAKLSQTEFRGDARMVRYADDAISVFLSMEDAERFRNRLTERLREWGLSLNEEKTRTIACGKKQAEKQARHDCKMPSFTFLGFLHVWGRSRNSRTGAQFWRIKRRTCPKRYRAKLKQITQYVKQHRHRKDTLTNVKRITQGYVNYFAVSDNGRRICQFIRAVRKVLYKWYNRLKGEATPGMSLTGY